MKSLLLAIAAMLVATTVANAETCSERAQAAKTAMLARGSQNAAADVARIIPTALRNCKKTGVWDTTGGGREPHGLIVRDLERR